MKASRTSLIIITTTKAGLVLFVLSCFCFCLNPTSSFQSSRPLLLRQPQQAAAAAAAATRRTTHPVLSPKTVASHWKLSSSSSSVTQQEDDNDNDSSPPRRHNNLSFLLTTLGLLSNILSWSTIAYVALSRHPTPAIDAAASTRHNLFTIAQALAFPLPLLVGIFYGGDIFYTTTTTTSTTTTNNTITTAQQQQQLHHHRRRRRRSILSLGLAVASFWTAAAVIWGPTFSVGYDLFSQNPWVLYGCSSVHIGTGVLALMVVGEWKRKRASGGRVLRGCIRAFFVLLSGGGSGGGSIGDSDNIDNSNKNDDDDDDDRALYSFASLGLFTFALLPQLVAFPTATIPTLLGKRLSRAASGFTFLGAVATYSLVLDSRENNNNNNDAKQDNSGGVLRRSLGIGALAHVSLVVAKLVGLDGGGWLLSGRGLWQNYPSLVQASGAAKTLMMVTYSVLAYVCLENKKKAVVSSKDDDI